MTAADGPPLAVRKRPAAFAVCLLAAGLTVLDVSKANVALDSIEQSLDASDAELQLVLAGFAFAFAITLVPSGRLGDLRGRKGLFVGGMVLFTVASLLCAVAPSAEWLVACRILQGAAAGIQIPQALGLTQQLYQGLERARAFGLLGASLGLGAAIGPLLGGILIVLGGEEAGWRLLFWLNIPLGLTGVLLAIRYVAPSPRSAERRGLDLVGTGMLGLGLLLAMTPFIHGPSSFARPLTWIWVGVGVLVLGLFRVLGALVRGTRKASAGPPLAVPEPIVPDVDGDRLRLLLCDRCDVPHRRSLRPIRSAV